MTDTTKKPKTRRQKFAERKKSLRKVLISFYKALEVDEEESKFWWAKIKRRITSIRDMYEEISNLPEPEKVFGSYVNNKEVVLQTEQWLLDVEAKLELYQNQFADVPSDYGHGVSSYKHFKEKHNG